jgi:hypothetical protein
MKSDNQLALVIDTAHLVESTPRSFSGLFVGLPRVVDDLYEVSISEILGTIKNFNYSVESAGAMALFERTGAKGEATSARGSSENCLDPLFSDGSSDISGLINRRKDAHRVTEENRVAIRILGRHHMNAPSSVGAMHVNRRYDSILLHNERIPFQRRVIRHLLTLLKHWAGAYHRLHANALPGSRRPSLPTLSTVTPPRDLRTQLPKGAG